MGIHSITHHPAALTITRPKSLVQPRFSPPSKLVPSYNKVSFPKTCIATPKRVSGSFQVKAELQSPMEEKAAADISQYKNILLPVTDKNPYLSEGTKQIREAVDNCERTTKFIYGHGILRSLFLRHSKGKEISSSGATRFATHFLSLRSLLDARVPLGFTFISEEWTRNDDFLRLRISIEGVDVASLVKESHYPFWSTVEEVVKILEPLVRVLRLVDGDQMSMGYIYEAMERAKESIKRYYENNEDKFQPIWNIIDQRWNRTLHKPIHGAAHLLNPSFFNEPNFNPDNAEIRINFHEVVEKMYPSSCERVTMHTELHQYINQTLHVDALKAAKTFRPDAWWDAYGFSLPNLRKLARAILSQPTSASACERNWSMFNNTQVKKRHLLSSKRLNDLVFVNFNMLLHERQLLQKNTQVIHLEDISLDPPPVEAISEHLSDESDDDTLETSPNVNSSYVSSNHGHDLDEGNDPHLDEHWDATGISH